MANCFDPVIVDFSAWGWFRRWRLALSILGLYICLPQLFSLEFVTEFERLSSTPKFIEELQEQGIFGTNEIKNLIEKLLPIGKILTISGYIYLLGIFLLYTRWRVIGSYMLLVCLIFAIPKAYWVLLLMDPISGQRGMITGIKSIIPFLDLIGTLFPLIAGSIYVFTLLRRQDKTLICVRNGNISVEMLEMYHKRRALRGLTIPQIRFTWRAVPHFVLSLGATLPGILLIGSGVIPAMLLGVAFISLSARQYRIGRRMLLLKAAQIRSGDWRSPILLVRSFFDDGLKIRTRTNFNPIRVFSREGTTFEEFLSDRLSMLGPVVAITGDPVELAPFGAARELSSVTTWKSKVGELFDEARLIAVVIGDTPGLIWEIEEALRRGHFSKLILIIPPLSSEELCRRWAIIRSVFENVNINVPEKVEFQFDDGKSISLVHSFDKTGRYVCFVSSNNAGPFYDIALRTAIGMSLDMPVKIVRQLSSEHASSMS